MSSLVELLTTSGKPTLIPEVMKKFKRLCRISDAYVGHAYDLLMVQLVNDHSEIRLSTFQMIDELFNRSHAFRELVVEDFQTLLELAVESNPHCPLPPPKLAATTLKNEAYKCIQQWYEKFGEAYKKLALGYHYLKSCKKVNFDAVSARIETERRQQEETERKLEENRLMKLEKVHNEMDDLSPDIELCLKEIENCIQLLLPHPDMFFIPETENLEEPSDLPINKTRISERDKSVNFSSSKHSNELETGATNNSDSETKSQMGTSFSVDHNTSTDQGKCEKCHSSHDPVATEINDKKAGRKHIKHKDSCDKETDGSGKACLCAKNVNCACEIGKTDPRINKDLSIENGKTSVKSPNRTSQTKTSEDCDNVKVTEGTTDNQQENSEEDDSDESDSDYEPVWDHSGLRQAYGLGSRNYQISVTVGGKDRLRETEDNKDIIQSLKDQYRLVKTKYLGEIKKWLKTMESNRAKHEDTKGASDLKTRLEEALKKCVELEVIGNPDKDDRDSESDDDFEEVAEKEGYEENVPEHVRLRAGE